MGVGKSTVCQILKGSLTNSVFLDGDGCWDMNPFQVTEETKQMVLDNICFLLQNFMRCSIYDYVIFGWVMDHQAIWDYILAHLDTAGWQVVPIALLCSPQALSERLAKDIQAGLRTADVLPRSLARLPLYQAISACSLDTSLLTPEQTVRHILTDF